jgi:hypothetical protein
MVLLGLVSVVLIFESTTSSFDTSSNFFNKISPDAITKG